MNFHGYLALVNKRNRIDCYSKPKWNRKLKRCCRIAYTDFKEQRKELTTNQCSVQNCHAKKKLPGYGNRKCSQCLPLFLGIKISHYHLNMLLVSYLKLPFLFSVSFEQIVNDHGEWRKLPCQIILPWTSSFEVFDGCNFSIRQFFYDTFIMKTLMGLFK